MMWAIVLLFCFVLVMTFGALLYGLYDPRVDNNEIFKVIASWGDKIVSALTVILGTKAIGNNKP
jgi:hypothetical protein